MLETTMRAASGPLRRLTDALAMAAGARGHDIGRDVPHAIVRVAEVVEGELTVCMERAPKLEYGLAGPRFDRAGAGVATVGGPERLFLRSDGGAPLEIDGSTARSRVRLTAGRHVAWVHRATGAGGRLLGNFPQAIPHVGLVNAALALTEGHPRLGAAA